MIGMRLIIGIVVSACVGKTVRAISLLMNVETIEGRNIGWRMEGQMEKLCIENNSFIWGVVKLDDSGNFRVGGTSVHQSVCIGRYIHHIPANGKRIR